VGDMAEAMKEVVGFEGKLKFDTSKPDGTLRKMMAVSCLEKLDWKSQTPLQDGLRQTYQWFLKNQDGLRK